MHCFWVVRLQVACCPKELLQRLCEMRHLRVLDLSDNPELLHDGGAAVAAADLCRLSACEQLDLSHDHPPEREALRCDVHMHCWHHV